MKLIVLPLALALCTLAASSSAFAQSDASARLRPIEGSVRNGGVYNVATGVWTRRPPQGAQLGPDVIYDNTCGASAFGRLDPGEVWTDEGRIPSPTSPDTSESRHGCATSYLVEGFQIAYCTDQTQMGVSIDFREAYVSCQPLVSTPTASIDLVGLPHATGLGPIACWTVVIDLTASAPASARTFTMLADADGTFDQLSDTFGWSFRMPLDAPVGNTGPLIRGAPLACSRFDGTVWDPAPNMAESGTGMGTRDQFRVDHSIDLASGCYYFSTNPFASFHLELYGDTCGASGPDQQAYCFGTSCPCGNVGASGHGCANSVNAAGAMLQGSGVASLSNDAVVLAGSGMPLTAPALFFQGNVQSGAGLGVPFGDGLKCASGSLVRLGIKTCAGGASSYPGAGDTPISVRGSVVSSGTRTYQVWYRDNATFCTTLRFNLTNGWQIYWSL
jgi:hypothetical protein